MHYEIIDHGTGSTRCDPVLTSGPFILAPRQLPSPHERRGGTWKPYLLLVVVVWKRLEKRSEGVEASPSTIITTVRVSIAFCHCSNGQSCVADSTGEEEGGSTTKEMPSTIRLSSGWMRLIVSDRCWPAPAQEEQASRTDPGSG